ncbi:HPC2-domain-containing protein, partial [Parathielavia appendiculata]
RQQQHYSSSPSLSSVPTGPESEPGSPTRILNAGRANIEMDEIIVDPSSVARFSIMQQQQPTEPPPTVPLTAAGLPRKKPGRKPGSTVKPKVPADGSSTNPDQPRQRRPRKPKDPNAPPAQRKRKAAATEASDATEEMDARSASGPPRQAKITELTPMRMALDARSTPTDVGFAPPAPKRESGYGSMNMQNLLNEEPQPKPQPAAPARQMFDPIRGNYDPIRESVTTRDPYGTGQLGSPRAPTQIINRASASPSIASLVDPQPAPTVMSPRPSYTNPTSQPRFQDSTSVPPSPSNAVRNAPQWMPKPTLTEARRGPPPTPAPVSASKPESKTISFTSMTSIPSAMSSAASTTPAAPAAPAQSNNKKIAAVVQQERDSHLKKARSSAASSSSPQISSLKDALPPLPSGPGNERSILDFGKARPGEELEAPSISLHIPLQPGESNKYVNFMRMAEERYGWDALHPRLAASRERKARIAAATAALERTTGSGRDDGEGEEMEEDIVEQGSDAGESNVEMGGVGATNGNGAGTSAKPARKKRNFKEDEYDKDDDFVDDSEMLWEEQAAASRDGFFVYSGPLIPEVEKPAASEERPRRGRGGRGRGGRGGARGGGEGGGGRGRGGGSGSRGGTVRKPRITKLEKEIRDREKAEREKLAQMASAKTGADAGAVSSGLLSSLGA